MITKDYAKVRTAKRRKPSSSAHFPGIAVWSMLFLGFIMAAVIYWKYQPSIPVFSEKKIDSTVPKKVKPKSKAQNPHPSSERFDFYNMLPKSTPAQPELEIEGLEPINNLTSEVIPSSPDVVSQPQPDDTASLAPVETESPSPSENGYWIQTGSFRQLSQAEEMKAKLALLGYEASIQTFKLDTKEIWFRVCIGPYSSKENATPDQLQLQQYQQIHSLIIKNDV